MKIRTDLLKGACLSAMSLASLAGGMPVCAQTPMSAGEGSGIHDDIVVTAQKREQRLQDVAGAISAVGSAQLELTGAKTVADITSSAPGLVVGQRDGLSFVTVRGVGLSIETGVAEPNVAVHVDGVYLPRATITGISGEDLERVELLRGPQGTLYGRNATGGALNMISKAPSSVWTGGAKFGYGNYETVSSSTFLSGPLSDRTRIRVSAAYTNRGDGYMKNLFTGRDFGQYREYTFRGAVQSDLTDDLVLDLSVMYQRSKGQPDGQLVSPFNRGVLALLPQLPNPSGVVGTSSPRTIASNFEGSYVRKTLLARAGLTWQISDEVHLKSITSYIDHRLSNTSDTDFTSASIASYTNYTKPSKSISQEFNLGGQAFDGNLNWLVGAYYFREKYKNIFPLVFSYGFPGFLPLPLNYFTQLDEKTTSLAAFTDMTYSLSPNFRVYAGARYSHEVKREFTNLTITAAGLGTLIDCPLSIKQEFNSFSPRVGIQTDVSQDVMAYAQYQKGFKSGGVNTSVCSLKFKPEKLDSYEVGFKSQFFDNAVTLNASAFYYDYKDLQIFRYTATGGNIDNAPARVLGAEVEALLRPASIFHLGLAATFLDAKYKDFLTFDAANLAGGVQNVRGQHLDRAPKYVLTVSPQFDIPVAFGDFDRLTLRGDMRFSGRSYFSPFNSAATAQKAYQTIDLSASLGGGEGLTVRAFVKNLTNKNILSSLGFTPVVQGYIGSYQAPRVFGAELGYKF